MYSKRIYSSNFKMLVLSTLKLILAHGVSKEPAPETVLIGGGKRAKASGILPLLGFLAVAGLLSAAFYLEYVEGILPCPLCILQRGFFFLIGSVFLIAFLCRSSPTGQRICGGLVLVFALGGISIAARQLWLQAHPQASPEICVPGFQHMLTNVSFERMLTYWLSVSSNCSEVSWTLLGLSLAAWALIAFICFACLGQWMWLREWFEKSRHQKH